MSTDAYTPQPDDLVTIGLSISEWKVMAVCGDTAWVRCILTGEDKVKSILRMSQVEVEPEVDTTENDAPLGHFLDSFFSVPKVA